MTITDPPLSKISSVAVIGGGPAGLTSVYELLHTSQDGISTVGGELPKVPAFSHIQGYEQLSGIGGVWNASLDKTDPVVPSTHELKSGRYNDPFVLKPLKSIPIELQNQKEFVRPLENHPQYSNSAVYNHLYTNIPQDYMGFSYLQNPPLSKSSIRPFLTHEEVLERLKKLSHDFGLDKFYRFNTEVELVSYDDLNKRWVVISRTIDVGKQIETWRSENFDGVIVAGGQNNIPYFPIIQGLDNYIEKFPGRVIHGKAYRTSEQLRDKKVLVIGSSSTASNIISTGFSNANKIYLSRKSAVHNFEYLNRVFASDGIISKPQVKQFNAIDGSIEFEDGSIVGDIDLIIIATGYLYHAPYLQQGLLNLNSSSSTPIYQRKADDLYLHSFHIHNPSLAFVGIPNTPTVWRAIETTAAAVAGVWSGATSLPALEEQLAWKLKRLEEAGDCKKFQQYPHQLAKQKLIDPLYELAAKGRQHPLPDESHVETINSGLDACERLFYDFKDGTLRE